MRKFILVMLLTWVSVFTTARAQTTEITILTSAQCQPCKTTIEKALLNEKGVRSAILDLKTKQVKVIYNSKKTTPESLRKAISNAGYDADNVMADNDAMMRLKPCCRRGGHD